jgi:hypothetical protein
MSDKAVAVLGLTLLVVLAAVSIPIAVESSTDTTTETLTLSEGNSATVNGDITVSLTETSQSEANVTVVNTENGDTLSRVIAEGSTETFGFSEGDIHITAADTTNQNAVLSLEYPNTFGYAAGTSLITDNLAIILVSMVFIGVMAFVGVGISRS